MGEVTYFIGVLRNSFINFLSVVVLLNSIGYYAYRMWRVSAQ